MLTVGAAPGLDDLRKNEFMDTDSGTLSGDRKSAKPRERTLRKLPSAIRVNFLNSSGKLPETEMMITFGIMDRLLATDRFWAVERYRRQIKTMHSTELTRSIFREGCFTSWLL